MSTNGRKGNRTSIPARGGVRRSNTPPPPSVRLGIDGLPESDPISTSRPRGPDDVPALKQPPADVVAAASAAQSGSAAESEPTAKAPAVVAAATVALPEPLPPPRPVLPTLHSAAEAVAVAQVNAVDEGMEEPAMSQPAPSVGPRSLSSPPGAMRRKGRGSNLRGGSSKLDASPASATGSRGGDGDARTVAPAAEARAEAPVPVVARAHEEHTAHADEPPVSAPPPASIWTSGSSTGATRTRRTTTTRMTSTTSTTTTRGWRRRTAPRRVPAARRTGCTSGSPREICVTLMAVALLRSSMHHTPEPVAEPPVVVTVIGQQPNAVVPKAEIPAAPPASAAAPAASTGEPGALHPRRQPSPPGRRLSDGIGGRDPRGSHRVREVPGAGRHARCRSEGAGDGPGDRSRGGGAGSRRSDGSGEEVGGAGEACLPVAPRPGSLCQGRRGGRTVGPARPLRRRGVADARRGLSVDGQRSRGPTGVLVVRRRGEEGADSATAGRCCAERSRLEAGRDETREPRRSTLALRRPRKRSAPL